VSGVRRILAGLALTTCLLGAGPPVHAEVGSASAPSAPAGDSTTPSGSESPSPSDGTDPSTEAGGTNWLGSLIGAGLLALAGWTLWRAARVSRHYRGDADRDPRLDDPDMRHDED
jgi:hypothetical protein